MEHIRPLGSNVSDVALMPRKVRDVVLGAKSIVHIVQVHDKVPGCYMTPRNEY